MHRSKQAFGSFIKRKAPEYEEQKNIQRPLKRNAKKRKITQRSGLNNDIVQLHARKMNQLVAATKDTSKLEGELRSLLIAWQQLKLDFTNITTNLQNVKRANRAINLKNRKEVMQQHLDSGVPGLQNRRQVLHGRLEEDRCAIMALEAKLMKTQDGTLQNDYLLDAIIYLNIHHTRTSDVVKFNRELADEKTLATQLPGLRTKINEANREIKSNVHAYTTKFFPDMIRDMARDTFDSTTATNPYICSSCGGTVVEVSNSHCVCEACGVVASTGFSLRDPTANLNWEDLKQAPSRQYSYRRLNHFREYIRQIQGKSRAILPPKLFEELKEEFRKVRRPLNEVTPTRVKAKLRKINQSRYYEHQESIAAILNPTYKPVDIDAAHEEKLCLMFVQLEEPFERVKHKVIKSRKNFLSYPFTFFKLNELNGWDDYNRNCLLLKSVQLINRQDKWWKLLMDELGWEVVGRTFDIHRPSIQ